jgi:hypothetical protein
MFCAKHQLYESQLLPPRLSKMLIAPGTWWISGLPTGLALLLEDPRRRAELALYVLPKALESVWAIAFGRGRTGAWGDGVLAGIGTSLLMVSDPSSLVAVAES